MTEVFINTDTPISVCSDGEKFTLVWADSTSAGSVDTISGAVDIVVSMRDAGVYSGDFIGNSGYWGDRLAFGYITHCTIVEIRNGEDCKYDD